MYQQYSYSDSYQQTLDKHHKKIQKLEKEIEVLKKLVNELHSRPTLHVDKIEYKFDQLKVETLEGTLNVGLTPQDLQNMDEFVTGQHPTPSPSTDPKNIVLQDLVEQNMNQYMDQTIPQIISDTQNQLGITADDQYVDFIRNDIKNQLKTRIQHHIKQLPHHVIQQEPQEQVVEMVSQRLKGEIQQGVFSFFSRFQQEQQGGSKKDGI
ncbi:spore germination protein GerPC [Bacillus carboniphilus]|uniref:Spore germination protein GerPC n=1 Tax=Bacillus carboniphilus TaxID=86663 RepID=A0ABN0VQ14_9BACI